LTPPLFFSKIHAPLLVKNEKLFAKKIKRNFRLNAFQSATPNIAKILPFASTQTPTLPRAAFARIRSASGFLASDVSYGWKTGYSTLF